MRWMIIGQSWEFLDIELSLRKQLELEIMQETGFSIPDPTCRPFAEGVYPVS